MFNKLLMLENAKHIITILDRNNQALNDVWIMGPLVPYNDKLLQVMAKVDEKEYLILYRKEDMEAELNYRNAYEWYALG